MNYYFSRFPWKPKNDATGLKKSEEINVAVWILGWIQLRHAGEGGRNVGSSVLPLGPEPGGDSCHAGTYRWGAEEMGSLLPSSALCLALGIQAFCDMRSFLIPCAHPCSTAQWLLEMRVPFGEWPAEPLRREAPAPSVPRGSAHPALTLLFATCICLLVSYVLSLRPEGIVRSPRLIGISMGQRVSLSSYVAGQGKE